jgi:hypothetical protein
VTARIAIGCAVALAAAACGGEEAPPAAAGAPERAGAATAATAATAAAGLAAPAETGPVVAEVDGAPIHAACVETQAAARGVTAREALDDCIGFELLAQEAARRGYGDRPDVRAVVDREVARQLVRRVFEPSFDGPEDIAIDDIKRVWARPEVHSRYNHPEYRFVVYARAKVSKEAPRGGDEDRAAEAVIRRIHDELGGKRGVTKEQLFATADRLGQGANLDYDRKPYNTPRHGRAAEEFAAAAFSIPEPGMVSAPTRTPWGWDIVLLLRITPLRRTQLAEAEPELRKQLFPSARKAAFLRWTAELARAHEIVTDASWLPRLAADTPERPLAP